MDKHNLPIRNGWRCPNCRGVYADGKYAQTIGILSLLLLMIFITIILSASIDAPYLIEYGIYLRVAFLLVIALLVMFSVMEIITLWNLDKSREQ